MHSIRKSKEHGSAPGAGHGYEVEVLKKKRLAIKDELYALLQKINLSRVRT